MLELYYKRHSARPGAVSAVHSQNTPLSRRACSPGLLSNSKSERKELRAVELNFHSFGHLLSRDDRAALQAIQP